MMNNGMKLGGKALNRLRSIATAFEKRPRENGPGTPGEAQPFPWIRKVKTKVGGIAASSSAACNPATWDGTSAYTIDTAAAQEITVWNPSTTQAVSGSTLITIAWASGRWECIMEPC